MVSHLHQAGKLQAHLVCEVDVGHLAVVVRHGVLKDELIQDALRVARRIHHVVIVYVIVTGCDTNAIEAGSDTDYFDSKLACSDDVSIATARDFSRRGN